VRNTILLFYVYIFELYADPMVTELYIQQYVLNCTNKFKLNLLAPKKIASSKSSVYF